MAIVHSAIESSSSDAIAGTTTRRKDHLSEMFPSKKQPVVESPIPRYVMPLSHSEDLDRSRRLSCGMPSAMSESVAMLLSVEEGGKATSQTAQIVRLDEDVQ